MAWWGTEGECLEELNRGDGSTIQECSETSEQTDSFSVTASPTDTHTYIRVNSLRY